MLAQQPPQHKPTPKKKDKRRFRGKTNRPFACRVQSEPDPAIYCARKSSGRPCVPGTLLEEPGTSGPPTAGVHWIPLSECVINILRVRWWAALPGFPPTQGLPELFLPNGTDRSEAAATRAEKGTPRPFP